MKAKLTERNLTSFPEGAEVLDTMLPGFCMRVGKESRTFSVRIKHQGVSHRRKLGRHPRLSLGEARRLAREELQRIEFGVVVSQVESQDAALTMGEVIDKYELWKKGHSQTGRKTLERNLQVVRNELGAHNLLKLPVTFITKRELKLVRDAIADRGAYTQSNRFLAYLSPIMRWAASEDIIEANSVPSILRRKKEESRERILSDEEIRRLWEATEGSSLPSYGAYQRLVRFCLLTACRRGEAAEMKWEDMVGHWWHQKENKASRPYNIYLTDLALRCMGPRQESGLVFAGETGALSGWGTMKDRLDQQSGIKNWVIHDLRRTAASKLQMLTHDDMVVKACLNHSISSGATMAYLSDTMAKPKQDAFELLSEYVRGLIDREALL